MISYNYESDFSLDNEALITKWIGAVIEAEDRTEGDIAYIFCDDDYLHNLNLEFLHHDTLTDIISFDYSLGNMVSGDIFISIERVKDNAIDFDVELSEELKRVIIHGVLHFCGYKDKSTDEQKVMRAKEDHYLAQLPLWR